MNDVQGEKDQRKIALKKVGIKDLKWPIKVMDKNLGVQSTVGIFELSVGLPSDERGTHMSRFIEAANCIESINPESLEILLINLIKQN